MAIARWDVKAAALALGLVWALGLLALGWAAAIGWGTEVVNVLSSAYIGYEPGFVGGLVGAAWGFLDGAVGGALLALIYNRLAAPERMEERRAARAPAPR